MYYLNKPNENKRYVIPDNIMYAISRVSGNKDMDIISYLDSHEVKGVVLEDYDFSKHSVVT